MIWTRTCNMLSKPDCRAADNLQRCNIICWDHTYIGSINPSLLMKFTVVWTLECICTVSNCFDFVHGRNYGHTHYHADLHDYLSQCLGYTVHATLFQRLCAVFHNMFHTSRNIFRWESAHFLRRLRYWRRNKVISQRAILRDR